MQAVTEELLGTKFSILSVKGSYNEEFSSESQSSFGVPSEELVEN
jgi:hypothetical protein